MLSKAFATGTSSMAGLFWVFFWVALATLLACPRSLDAKHADSPSRDSSFSSRFESVCVFQPPDPSAENLQREMKKYLGIPYRWGGSSTKGMDCSGLTKKMYAKVFGVELPHNSVQQSRMEGLEEVRPSKRNLRMGDLLFFGPRKKRINHVGIYLSDGKFLHSCESEGVTVSSLNKAYWRKRLITSKRLKRGEVVQSIGSSGFSIAQWALPASLLDPFEGSPPSFEVGYRRSVLGLPNLNLDTFMSLTATDNLFGGDGRSAMYAGHPGWGQRDRRLAYEQRQGFRLSANLDLFEWLRITPSFTQMGAFAFEREDQDASQYVGLETLLRAPSSRWSFAVSARAENQNDLSGSYGADAGWSAVDLSFGLHYRHSDHVNFSLIGTHEPASLSHLDVTRGVESEGASNLAFKINLAF